MIEADIVEIAVLIERCCDKCGLGDQEISAHLYWHLIPTTHEQRDLIVEVLRVRGRSIFEIPAKHFHIRDMFGLTNPYADPLDGG